MASPLARGLFAARDRAERRAVRRRRRTARRPCRGRSARGRLPATARRGVAGGDARPPAEPSSPRRRGSASGRSSTGDCCPDRSTRSSPTARRPMFRCWPAGPRTKGSTSPCRAATRSGAPTRLRCASASARRRDGVLAHYPGGAQASANAAALGGDLVIINKTWAWIEAQKATGARQLFRYRFDRAPPVRPGWFGARDVSEAGAFHAGDIPYVLDTLDAMPWAYTRGGSRDRRGGLGLLAEFRARRRSQRIGPAALAVLSRNRRGHADRRRMSRGAGSRTAAPGFPARVGGPARRRLSFKQQAPRRGRRRAAPRGGPDNGRHRRPLPGSARWPSSRRRSRAGSRCRHPPR